MRHSAAIGAFCDAYANSRTMRLCAADNALHGRRPVCLSPPQQRFRAALATDGRIRSRVRYSAVREDWDTNDSITLTGVEVSTAKKQF